jgi:hypothetical protein
MRKLSDKICRENQNTHFIFNNFFLKLFRLSDNMQKYCGAGQDKDDYGACALHVGYLGLQIQIENM